MTLRGMGNEPGYNRRNRSGARNRDRRSSRLILDFLQMNTHDMIELPPLPKASKMYDIPGYDEEELKDYARAAIEADRKRRKPQHIDPELKAAIEDAATTRSPVAITKDGRGVMLNYVDEEDRMAEHEDNACAYCGGSGHKGDVADRQLRGEPVAWIQRSYLNLIRESNVALHNVVVRGSILDGDGDVVPLFTAPQPAEPVKRKRRYAQGTALGEFGIIPMCDQVDDEPVEGAR